MRLCRRLAGRTLPVACCLLLLLLPLLLLLRPTRRQPELSSDQPAGSSQLPELTIFESPAGDQSPTVDPRVLQLLVIEDSVTEPTTKQQPPAKEAETRRSKPAGAKVPAAKPAGAKVPAARRRRGANLPSGNAPSAKMPAAMPPDAKVPGEKHSGAKMPAGKSPEAKTREGNLSGAKTLERKPSGAKTREENLSGAKTLEGKPSGAKTREGNLSGAKTREGNPSGAKTPEGNPSGAKTPEGKPSGAKTLERKPSGAKTREESSSGAKVPEDKPSGAKMPAGKSPEASTPEGKPPGAKYQAAKPPGAKLPAGIAQALDTNVTSDSAELNPELAAVRSRMEASLYFFDRVRHLLPLLRPLSASELVAGRRAASAVSWLRTQNLVVVATVRNALPGLAANWPRLAALRRLFNDSWLVLVENDSEDGTRRFLLDKCRGDPSITLLPAACQPPRLSCRVGIRYSTGKLHRPSWRQGRTRAELLQRAVVMAALRNVALRHVYRNFANTTGLLLVADLDVQWQPWRLHDIAQGLYWFQARPQLQQLCANSLLFGSDIFDLCTIAFFNNRHFGEIFDMPTVDYLKSIGPRPPADMPPVKVATCFQGFAFYRLRHLVARQLMYGPSNGEVICEHNTLSRQLQHVYLDPQMKLVVNGE